MSNIKRLQVWDCASGHESVNVLLLQLLRLLTDWITWLYLNTVWMDVFVNYAFRSLCCLKVWSISLLKEWHNPLLRWSLWFCWRAVSGIQTSAHCVNTARETWPQLKKLMTGVGVGGAGCDSIHSIKTGMWYMGYFQDGRDVETTAFKAETPVKQAKRVANKPSFEP